MYYIDVVKFCNLQFFLKKNLFLGTALHFLEVFLHKHSWFKWSAHHRALQNPDNVLSFEIGVLEQEKDWRTQI